jgi:hypothetical protein
MISLGARISMMLMKTMKSIWKMVAQVTTTKTMAVSRTKAAEQES